MPVSKKRKRKNGAVAKFRQDRYDMRRAQIMKDIEDGEHMSTGVSLQDLINLVAYQEYQEAGLVEGPVIPDNAGPDLTEVPEGPHAEEIIRALDKSKQNDKVNDKEEDEDGR